MQAMSSHRSTTLTILIASLVPAVSCGDDTTGLGTVGPFGLTVVASVNGGNRQFVADGQMLTLDLGDEVMVSVQAVDSRGNPAPGQSSTRGNSTNALALPIVAAVFNDDRNEFQFLARSIAPGTSSLVFTNGRLGASRIVIIRVVSS